MNLKELINWTPSELHWIRFVPGYLKEAGLPISLVVGSGVSLVRDQEKLDLSDIVSVVALTFGAVLIAVLGFAAYYDRRVLLHLDHEKNLFIDDLEHYLNRTRKQALVWADQANIYLEMAAELSQKLDKQGE